MRIDVRDNFAQVKGDLARLQRDIREKAIARALNRTAEQAKTAMVRNITQAFEIKAGEVRALLVLRPARPGFFGGLLTAELRALQNKRGRGLNLIRFLEKKVTFAEAKRRARAGTLNRLGFRIKRGGGVKRIDGAFIGNKGRTVFRRVPDTTMASRARYAGSKHAEKIAAVTTIDVPQMFNTRRVNAAVVKVIREKFPEILARETRFYVERFGR